MSHRKFIFSSVLFEFKQPGKSRVSQWFRNT